jgi:5-(carboxyamino)imidazole ribonucleotide synthase
MEAAQAFSQENPNAYLHFYGKLEAKHNRKMGHVTVFSDALDEMREF